MAKHQLFFDLLPVYELADELLESLALILLGFGTSAVEDAISIDF